MLLDYLSMAITDKIYSPQDSTFNDENNINAGVPLFSISDYDLNQKNIKALDLSNDSHPKPSVSQAATSAFV